MEERAQGEEAMSDNEKPVVASVADALRNDAADILDLIDGGLQSYEDTCADGGGPDSASYRMVVDNRGQCWRCQRRVAGAEMDGACDPCTTWLREGGDDPMASDPLTTNNFAGILRRVIDEYTNTLRESTEPATSALFQMMQRRLEQQQRETALRAIEQWAEPSAEYTGFLPAIGCNCLICSALREARDASETPPIYRTLSQMVADPGSSTESAIERWQQLMRERLVSAQELRIRAQLLATNYGFELATESDVADIGGLVLPEEPETVADSLGLEVVRWIEPPGDVIWAEVRLTRDNTA